MPRPAHQSSGPEVISLSEATYFVVTGRRCGREYSQKLMSWLKRRAGRATYPEGKEAALTAWQAGQSDAAQAQFTQVRSIRWWERFEQAARSLIEAAQRGDVAISGVAERERQAIPAGYLAGALYADPSTETVRPEILPELGGDWLVDGPTYRAVTFRRSQLQKLRDALHTGTVSDSETPHETRAESASSASVSAPPEAVSTGGKSRKRRTQPRRVQAAAVLQKLFPQGVPEPSELPNADLVKQVQDSVPAGVHKPGRDTILRAAGRRN
jgi:hypothetical protein